jgi:hypothetical protein
MQAAMRPWIYRRRVSFEVVDNPRNGKPQVEALKAL